MEDDLTPGNRLVHALVTLDVALDQLNVLAETDHVRAPTCCEVVKNTHVVAAVEQMLDQVRADETAAAGDEDSRLGHASTAPGAGTNVGATAGAGRQPSSLSGCDISIATSARWNAITSSSA